MDEFRAKKAQALRSAGMIPYAALFDRTHMLESARNLEAGESVRIAGRIVLLRDMGKMTFLTLQDHTGRMQVAMKEETVGADAYRLALDTLDLGDIIGVAGEHFTTQKGEPTIMASSWTMLTKALRSPPEKWHGIQDQETAWRQRYLDLTSNRPTFERFMTRSNFVRALREFYWSQGFVEVETPVLTNAASGALATPFVTHHEAYDTDVFLRIAPETYLKECLVGGFDRVFEVARVFRNEGLDPSHLQDFTMVEHYASYWDYRNNMDFTEQMFGALQEAGVFAKTTKIPNRDGELVDVNFAGSWPRISIRDLIRNDCGIDIDACDTAAALREAMKSNGITLEVPVEQLGRGSLIDQLYKKVSRPKLTAPTFVIQHPIDLSPLARRNDENPNIVDRFQLVVGGWEVVNAYSELTDPADQNQRFHDQAKAFAHGDSEAHRKDDDFVTALEYGCPPCSGWGMGVDRIVALLTQQANLRDVVLFPLMKPDKKKEAQETKGAEDSQRQKQLPSASASHMLQHAEYGHLLPAAHGLLEEHATNTKAHLIATGVAMEALAKKFGGDPQTWKVAGMLHDLDWDSLDKDWERHCGDELATMLRGISAPDELLGDIRAHYAHRYGEEYPLNTMLRKCLYCVDELTGFIIAVTYVRPSRKIADVEVSSVKKKLKDKGFAAQVDREQIRTCEALLNIPLDEFIAITLESMKQCAGELGL